MRSLLLKIDCGEKTCKSSPKKSCKHLMTTRYGTTYFCSLWYDLDWRENPAPLHEKDGWVPITNLPCPPYQSIELRIRINVIVISENKVPIANRTAYWEMGVTTFKRLLKLRNDHGLDNWFYEIERLDNTIDPSYSMVPYREIDEDERNEFARLPRLDLSTLI